MIIYQRFLGNPILNFVDLCSVSNISVFILDEDYHGYYIHGRCPYGRSEMNIKEMLVNFYRENHRMTSTRGLEMQSQEQLFILKITRDFRREFDLVFIDGRERICSSEEQTREKTEQYANQMHESYQNINRFLCAFINHSLLTLPYFVRQRYLWEKIFNYEFPSNFYNLFLVGKSKFFSRRDFISSFI